MKSGKISEKMNKFCFVTFVTDLNGPNTIL
jgi:hypothetical protein